MPKSNELNKILDEHNKAFEQWQNARTSMNHARTSLSRFIVEFEAAFDSQTEAIERIIAANQAALELNNKE